LITNATNPKVLIFYLAFFPQFVGSASSVTSQLSLLAVVFLVVTTLWLIPVVYAASAMREFFARPGVAIALEVTVGAVFFAPRHVLTNLMARVVAPRLGHS